MGHIYNSEASSPPGGARRAPKGLLVALHIQGGAYMWLSICLECHVWWCRFITCAASPLHMTLFGGVGRRLSLCEFVVHLSYDGDYW